MAEQRHYIRAISDWDKCVNFDFDGVKAALLMGIYHELRQLNSVFGCTNVQRGFAGLRRIAKAQDIEFKRRVDAAVKKRLARKATKKKGRGMP